MSIICTVRSESFTTAEQLSALLGKKITPEVANKLISEAENAGYLEKEEDEKYDFDDVLQAIAKLSEKSDQYQSEEKTGIEKVVALLDSFQEKTLVGLGMSGITTRTWGEENKETAYTNAARILDIEQDSRTILNTEHDFIREAKAQDRGMLVDCFGGNFAVMTAVTKGLANTVIEEISGDIRNNAFRVIDEDIAKLEKMKEEGVDENGVPLTRNKLSKIEADIEGLYKRRNNIYDNGIYAMAEDSEIVTEVMKLMRLNLNAICRLRAAKKKYIKSGHDESETAAYMKKAYPGTYRNLYFRPIGEATKKLADEAGIDFTIGLFDGYINSNEDESEVVVFTDEERFRAMERRNIKGLEEAEQKKEVVRAWIARDWWKDNRNYSWFEHEGEDEAEARRRAEGRERDRRIKERRAASDAKMNELINGILTELTNRTGVAFGLSYNNGMKERGVSQDVEDTLAVKEDETDRPDEDVTNESTDEDMYEDEHGRDAQFVEAFERSSYSTVRSHAKRVLANLLQYKMEKDADGNVKFVPISEYGGHRMMDPMTAFSHFLLVIPEQNNGKGFVDSNALYEWLKEQQYNTPWYHGIVEEMERNPKLKTEFFVSFNKELQQYRSVHMRGTAKEDSGSGETNISYGENSRPQIDHVMSAIRINMNNGINLQTDTYFKGMVVERKHQTDFTAFYDGGVGGVDADGWLIQIDDITAYDSHGIVNKGKFYFGIKDFNAKYEDAQYEFNGPKELFWDNYQNNQEHYQEINKRKKKEFEKAVRDNDEEAKALWKEAEKQAAEIFKKYGRDYEADKKEFGDDFILKIRYARERRVEDGSTNAWAFIPSGEGYKRIPEYEGIKKLERAISKEIAAIKIKRPEGRIIAKASGLWGFQIFIDEKLGFNVTLPKGMKWAEYVAHDNRTFDEMERDPNSPKIRDVVIALRVLGLDITEDGLRSAMSKNPRKFYDVCSGISLVANTVRKQDGTYMFDGAKLALRFLAESIYDFGEFGMEASTRWGEKQIYSYVEKNWIDTIVDNLGDYTNDEAVENFIDSITHYKDEDVTTFYVEQRANGERYIANGILRDCMKLEDNEKDNIDSNKNAVLCKADKYRRALRMGKARNLGVQKYTTDGVSRQIPYKKMSPRDKVTIDLTNFFIPRGNKAETLEHMIKITTSRATQDYNLALYALPIMADSGNHIFVGARKFWSCTRGVVNLKRENETIKRYEESDYLGSYALDGLFDRCADIVFSEADRIKVMTSNAQIVDGKKVELDNPQFGKTFNKNKGRFCAFELLEEMSVKFEGDNRVYSFYEALQLMRANVKDSTGAQITFRNHDYPVVPVVIDNFAGEKPEARRVPEDVPAARLLAMRGVELSLRVMFMQDMAYWKRIGLFNGNLPCLTSTAWNFSASQSDMSFHDAKECLRKRSVAIDAFFNDDKAIVMQGDLSQEQTAYLKDLKTPTFDENYYYGNEEYRETKKKKYIAIYESIVHDLEEYIKQAEESAKKSNDNKEGGIYGRTQIRKKGAPESVKDLLKVLQSLHPMCRYGSDKSAKKYDCRYENELMAKMMEYSWNKTAFRVQALTLLMGDPAFFKGITDLSKRSKGYVAAYEHCDTSAVCTAKESEAYNQPILDYYGEEKVNEYKDDNRKEKSEEDKTERDRMAEKIRGRWVNRPMWNDRYWDPMNQRSIVCEDFIITRDRDGRMAGFHGVSPFIRDVLVPEIEAKMQLGIISKEEHDEFLSMYEGLTASDGQSFRTFPSMYKLLTMLGLNNSTLDRMYEKVMIKGERLDWYDVQQYMNQTKTVAFGVEETDVNYTDANGKVHQYRMRIADFVKDSQLTMMMYTKELSEYMGGEDAPLCGVMRFMEDHHIDTIHFESTKKTCQFNKMDFRNAETATEAYDMLETQYNDAFGTAKDVIHAESWNTVGRQVPTKEHHIDKMQGIGTQVDKLIIADLEDTFDGVAEDGRGGYVAKRNVKTKINEYDDFGPDATNQVKASLTPRQLVNQFNRVKVMNMSEDLTKLEEILKDKEKLSEKLLSMVDSSNRYAQNIRDALQLVENPVTHEKDFALPLNNPIVTEAVLSMVMSLIKKNVIKQKTKGGSFVQFSNCAANEALKVNTAIDPETGMRRIVSFECKVSIWSKDLIRAYGKKDENGRTVVDINDVPADLRCIIGYRIPTEHIDSAIPMIVTGFLPDEMDSSIEVPQEIIAMMGSDFDVDKLYFMVPEFTVRHRGHNSLVSRKEYYRRHPEDLSYIFDKWKDRITDELSSGGFSGEDKTLRSLALSELIRHQPGKNFNNYCQAVKNDLESGNDGFIEDILTKEERGDLNQKIEDFIEEIGIDVEVDHHNSLNLDETDESVLRKAGRAERNNLLFRLMWARLTSPCTYYDLTRPGGFEPQRRVARTITILANQKGKSKQYSLDDIRKMDMKAVNALAEEYEKKIYYAQGSADDQLFERNMMGANLVGICALHNAFHAVIQHAKCELDPEFVKLFWFNVIKTVNGRPVVTEYKTVLGQVRNEDMRSICKTIGGTLSAALDNAKDPLLEALFLNPQTADLALTFLHMGYSLETTCVILNQPIVKAFFREVMDGKSSFSFNKKFRRWCRSVGVYQPFGKNDEKTYRTLDLDRLAMKVQDEISSGEFMGLSSKEAKRDIGKDVDVYSTLSVIYGMTYISDNIKCFMDATKITSPFNNISSTVGETVKRMWSVRHIAAKNACVFDFLDVPEGGEPQVYNIFKKDDIDNLIIADFEANRPKEDDDLPGKAEEYIEGYIDDEGNTVRPRLPYVQACYDMGFVRTLDSIGGNFSVFSQSMYDALMRLDAMRYDDRTTPFKENVITALSEQLRFYNTIVDLFKDEMDVYETVGLSGIRQAYMMSMPQFYTNTVQELRKEGRDICEEFPILRHIEMVAPGGGEVSNSFFRILRLSLAGRAGNAQRNEYVQSWDNLYMDPDPRLRKLALMLYKYSMLYNGGKNSNLGFGGYAPASVLSEFKEYNDALRTKAFGRATPQFIDQFVRNNRSLLMGSVIMSVVADYDKEEGARYFFHIDGYEALPNDEVRINTAKADDSIRELIQCNYIEMSVYGSQLNEVSKSVLFRCTERVESHEMENGQMSMGYVVYKPCEYLGEKMSRFNMMEYDPTAELNESHPIMPDYSKAYEESESSLYKEARAERRRVKKRFENLSRNLADMADVAKTLELSEDGTHYDMKNLDDTVTPYITIDQYADEYITGRLFDPTSESVDITHGYNRTDMTKLDPASDKNMVTRKGVTKSLDAWMRDAKLDFMQEQAMNRNDTETLSKIDKARQFVEDTERKLEIVEGLEQNKEIGEKNVKALGLEEWLYDGIVSQEVKDELKNVYTEAIRGYRPLSEVGLTLDAQDIEAWSAKGAAYLEALMKDYFKENKEAKDILLGMTVNQRLTAKVEGSRYLDSKELVRSADPLGSTSAKHVSMVNEDYYDSFTLDTLMRVRKSYSKKQKDLSLKETDEETANAVRAAMILWAKEKGVAPNTPVFVSSSQNRVAMFSKDSKLVTEGRFNENVKNNAIKDGEDVQTGDAIAALFDGVFDNDFSDNAYLNEVIANLNERQVVISGKVMTEHGERFVAGRADLLVKHLDGTLSIYNIKVYDEKQKGGVIAQDEDMSAERWKRDVIALNTFVQLLRSRYPDMNIRDIGVIPVALKSSKGKIYNIGSPISRGILEVDINPDITGITLPNVANAAPIVPTGDLGPTMADAIGYVAEEEDGVDEEGVEEGHDGVDDAAGQTGDYASLDELYREYFGDDYANVLNNWDLSNFLAIKKVVEINNKNAIELFLNNITRKTSEGSTISIGAKDITNNVSDMTIEKAQEFVDKLAQYVRSMGNQTVIGTAQNMMNKNEKGKDDEGINLCQ